MLFIIINREKLWVNVKDTKPNNVEGGEDAALWIIGRKIKWEIKLKSLLNYKRSGINEIKYVCMNHKVYMFLS